MLSAHFSTYFSAVHSVVFVCVGNIRVLFKLLLQSRNEFKHSESLRSFACNQNIKEDIPTALKAFLCFETKRKERKRKQIFEENIHSTQE